MPRSARLFIYRREASPGAVALATALKAAGIPARKISRQPRRTVDGDKLVAWGDYMAGFTSPALNHLPPVGKLTELEILQRAGVATVTFARAPGNAGDWLGRAFSHHSGDDLLTPPARPGFWVMREQVAREFRVHVWNGVSARVGMKVPRVDFSGPWEGCRREGVCPHPWIRSHAAGWVLDYGEGARQVKQRHRDAAKAAVSALHLDFGAVDVGERPDGSVFVFEVNRAPGLEGKTVEVYARKVAEWWNTQST